MKTGAWIERKEEVESALPSETKRTGSSWMMTMLRMLMMMMMLMQMKKKNRNWRMGLIHDIHRKHT